MELLHGQTLADKLSIQPVVSFKRSVLIAQEVCAALAEAHRMGVIHRDIKPGNVFLHRTVASEVVKVVDFGVAKLFGENPREEQPHLTRTGYLVGTPMYTAPERLNGGPYDGRADVFSVGVMLYEMLAGCLPFPSSPLPAPPIGLALLKEELPPLSIFRANVPAELTDIVCRALACDPSERPTAQFLAEQLRTLADSLDASEPIVAVPDRDIAAEPLPATQEWLRALTDRQRA
jgi:serine/threonine protein kinase